MIMNDYMNAPNVGLMRTNTGVRESTWAALGPDGAGHNRNRNTKWLKQIYERNKKHIHKMAYVTPAIRKHLVPTHVDRVRIMWANIIIGGVNGKGVTRSRLRGMQPISTIDGGRVGSRPMLSEWGPVTWPVVDKIGPPTEREGRKYTDGVVVTVEHWEGVSVEYARWFHRTRGTKIEDYKVAMPGSISTKVSRLRRGEQPPGIGDTQRRIISRPKENNNTRINNSVQQSSTPTVRTQVWDRRIELANPVRKKRRTKQFGDNAFFLTTNPRPMAAY